MPEDLSFEPKFREIIAERLAAYAEAVATGDNAQMVAIGTDIISRYERCLEEIDTLRKIVAAREDLTPPREH